MSGEVPGWLAAWRQEQGVSVPGRAVPAPRPAERPPAPDRPPTDQFGFAEPRRWPWDGGVRREPVLDCDHNPPRVVRHVGWRTCMRCRKPFFSEDVLRQRLCASRCRNYEQKTAQ